MTKPAASTTLTDGLITFGATYVMLTISGNLKTYLWTWGWARFACLALFAMLVWLYAFGTGPGRRTGWRGFLLCGALLPGFVLLAAIIGYALALSYDDFKVYEALTAGFGVGARI